MRSTRPGVKTKDLCFVAPDRSSFQDSRSKRRRGRTSTDRRQGREASLPAFRAQIVLVGLVIVAPHLLGGVFAWATLALALAAVAALGLALMAIRSTHHRPGERDSEPIAGLLVIMLTATVVHAIPLPAALASWLAPDALANAQATARGLGATPPEWVAFTLDPGGTYERVLFGVALFAAFCAVRLETDTSRHLTLLRAVAASAILIAFSDVLHRSLGATKVYGIYTPDVATVRGPLLNPNNLAGFLALGFPVCLGLAVQTRSGARWIWTIGAAVVAAVGMLAGSRGGTAVLAGGGLLFGAMYALRSPAAGGARRAASKESDRDLRGRFAGPAILLVSVGIAAALATLAADDFIDTDYQDLTKLDIYRAEWELLLKNPQGTWLGVGRGAFSAAFTPVSRWSARALQAESLPLQYAVEFGLPLAVILLGGATIRVFFALTRWRSPAQLGGLVGIVAITLQNLLDFSLELSGIALPAVVCLAASLPRTQLAWTRWLTPWGLRRTSMFGLAACSVFLVAFGARATSNDRALAERELKKHIANHDSGAFWARLREVAPMHPADSTFALMAASQRVRERHPDADFWLSRATQLAPGSALPHLWRAHSLALNGKMDAALGELGIAAQLDPQKTLGGLCPWIARAPTARTVLRIAPQTGGGRIAVLDAGAQCLGAYPSQAEEVDRLLLAASPSHLPARLRQAQRDIAAKRWDVALLHGRAIAQDAPTIAAPRLVEANALIGLSKPQEAVTGLLAALPNTDDRSAILTGLASAQTSAGDADGMRRSVEQLRMAGAGSAQKLAAAAARLSEYEERLGNLARALKAAREAHSLSPSPGALSRAASLANGLGQTDFALSAWQQLCAEQPDSKQYCAARDALLARRKQVE